MRPLLPDSHGLIFFPAPSLCLSRTLDINSSSLEVHLVILNFLLPLDHPWWWR